MTNRKRINLELIRCPICAAALMDEEDEKAHAGWHEINAALLAERPHPGGHLEGLVDDMLNGQRMKFTADENTPYVDNAGTDKGGLATVGDSHGEMLKLAKSEPEYRLMLERLKATPEQRAKYLEGSW